MRGTYLGLFFTSLAALMLEILLTRVFSVATWYYFAFFAISVAMFGLTVGALAVYIGKNYFTAGKLYERLTLFSVLLGVSIDVSLMIFLSVPFSPRLTGVGVFSTTLLYLVISVPFACAGVIVCLCLTRFPDKIGALYAADLIGAGIGAFLVFPVLNAMDAPTAIFFVGAVASVAALFFSSSALEGGDSRLTAVSRASFLVLTAVMLVNLFFQPVRVEWVKAEYNVPQVEAWNSFSRIAVYPFKLVKIPYSWGLSPNYVPDHYVGQRMIDIDGVSETVMTMYDGTPRSTVHLKYDVTSIAHYLRENAKVFIIGVGGGRDILAAKAFNQPEIVGAEINNRTLEMINDYFGDFTGHLDRMPGVRIINDEARSAITRMDEKFDIIQASCIATWSATTAGAFSLAENSLYTVEGWKIFYDHLTPNGVLSFNRWYSKDYPAQLLRLASLASVTLKNAGVTDPGRHIIVVRNPIVHDMMPSGTILVSKSPFTDADLKKLTDAVTTLGFKYEYVPGGYRNALFTEVIDNAGNPAYYDTARLDLSPSTDDRPFFFYMIRAQDIFSLKKMDMKEQGFNYKGIMILYILLGISIVLCAVFVVVPLLLSRATVPIPAGAGAVGLAFFASIGFGYILVEIAVLQRLVIFLGHPIYSITVVIFSMLLSSGAGSMVSGRLTRDGKLSLSHIVSVMVAVMVLLFFITFRQTHILPVFEHAGIYTRIFVSLLFLIPAGFVMGMPFPFGMSVAAASYSEHTPWFWAMNGAAGVVASVLSVCISIEWGFTATLMTGMAFYAVAAVALLIFHSREKEQRAP